MTCVLFQGVQALAFVSAPTFLYPSATDATAQFFVRITGVCLLTLVNVFWSFRHIPIQIGGIGGIGGLDPMMASTSIGIARTFTKFHTMVALTIAWSVCQAGLSVPYWRVMLGLHTVWAMAMTCAVMRNHQSIHGHIIDTSSGGAAVQSVVQIIKGDDAQPRTMLQMIKGEDSSRGVVAMIQGQFIPLDLLWRSLVCRVTTLDVVYLHRPHHRLTSLFFSLGNVKLGPWSNIGDLCIWEPFFPILNDKLMNLDMYTQIISSWLLWPKLSNHGIYVIVMGPIHRRSLKNWC